MRQLTARSSALRVRDAPVQPLIEPNISIVKRRKHRSWKSMTDGELVAYAKRIIADKGIKNRKGLENVDRCLYEILRRRKLLDSTSLERQTQNEQRNWKSMTDDALAAYALDVVGREDITARSILLYFDNGLYSVLSKRGLMGLVIPEKQKRRDWVQMSDNEVIAYAHHVTEENKLTHRDGLKKTDASLYCQLLKRKLLDRIPLKHRNQISWKSMSDYELVAYARQFISEKKKTNRKGLHDAAHGLYVAILGRELIERVFASNGNGTEHNKPHEKRVSSVERFLLGLETKPLVVPPTAARKTSS